MKDLRHWMPVEKNRIYRIVTGRMRRIFFGLQGFPASCPSCRLIDPAYPVLLSEKQLMARYTYV